MSAPLSKVCIRRMLCQQPPRTRRQLHAWVRAALGFSVPTRALVSGHDAPLDYLCHAFFEEQRPARAANALVWAARGSGKTQLAAIATLLDLIFKPGIRVCILGGSFAQSAAMHEHLRHMLERDALHDLVQGRITRERIELRNGSCAMALGQSHTDIRGRRVHRLRCDEIELFQPELWEAAQMVTRSGRCGDIEVRAGVEALSTMHRPFGMMNRLLQQAGESGTRVFRWSVLDALERCPITRACDDCSLFADGCAGAAKNPARRGFVRIDDALNQRSRISGGAWRAEMLCQRPDISACVYAEFDEARHVFDHSAAPANDDSITWLGGIDFGYRGPTALVLAMHDGGGRVHIMDEIIQRACPTPRMIELARLKLAALGVRGERLRWIGADPAGLQRSDQTGVSTITLWRRAGFTVRTRATTIEAGIERVRARLGAPGSDAAPASPGMPALRISRGCTALIRALREYHYDPEQPESTTPVKDGPDHAADALRYLIVNLDGLGDHVQRRAY